MCVSLILVSCLCVNCWKINIYSSSLARVANLVTDSLINFTPILYIVAQAMLHFIYRDTLVEDELVASSSSSNPSDSLTAKLLAAADRYDLGRLRRMCESYLCKEICVNSVAKTLALADCYHAAELKAVCLRFAAENLAGKMLNFYWFTSHVITCNLSKDFVLFFFF